jgi:hypothetical protein
MKDKRQVPMKGDRAMIVGVRFHLSGTRKFSNKSENGLVVDVLSDPLLRRDTEGEIYLMNLTGPTPVTNGTNQYIATRCLLRIPPDEDMKQMFADEVVEKPRKTKA